MSMLSEPREGSFAVGPERWVDLREAGLEELPVGEPEAIELQVWRYDPEKLSADGAVDPLSLYLSLESIDDERISSSLSEMMERVPWSS
jgi:hypothetical protein